MLLENARKPYVELAKALGVSETAIRKRIKTLEKEGVIRRYTVEVDPRKLGFQVNAFIGLDVKPEHYVSALEKVKALREVRSLYTSTGDHMLLAECWLKNSEELANLIKTLEAIPGVTRVCPAIILEKVK
ncbi:MAG: Lrp/AsnC family transcriptional regulator [Candidatus Hecatellaceae archaeon]